MMFTSLDIRGSTLSAKQEPATTILFAGKKDHSKHVYTVNWMSTAKNFNVFLLSAVCESCVLLYKRPFHTRVAPVPTRIAIISE